MTRYFFTIAVWLSLLPEASDVFDARAGALPLWANILGAVSFTSGTFAGALIVAHRTGRPR